MTMWIEAPTIRAERLYSFFIDAYFKPDPPEHFNCIRLHTSGFIFLPLMYKPLSEPIPIIANIILAGFQTTMLLIVFFSVCIPSKP